MHSLELEPWSCSSSRMASPLAHVQVPVGMQYLSALAILYAFHLVCISRSAHTLCCPRLHPPSQRLRHGLATASRTCQDKCCNAIVRALEGTLHDFEIWILGRIGRVGRIVRVGRIGRVGIIGRMTVPILTCFFFQDANVSSLDYLAPVRPIILYRRNYNSSSDIWDN